jgi:hypothetical protein
LFACISSSQPCKRSALPSTKREMASLAAWVDLFGLPLGRPAGIPWLIYRDCLFCETVYFCYLRSCCPCPYRVNPAAIFVGGNRSGVSG